MKNVKVYYLNDMRSIFTEPKIEDVFDSTKYSLVSSFEEDTTHKDEILLEHLFYIFNWMDPRELPDNSKYNFDRKDSQHSSMSVGDIVQIDEIYYFCDSFGWTKLKGVA